MIAVQQIKYKPVRIEYYLERTVANYTNQQFQQHFRISLDAYEDLLRIIGPQLKRHSSTGRPTINVEKQILAVIWLLATPDSYRSVAEKFDMGKSSLSTCFFRVVKMLIQLAPRVIKWPVGEHCVRVKHRFRQKAGLPNVIGAVDGTFIEIKAPQEDPNSYITRKCNYAITLQAICDSFLKFTDVFVGFPGSVSDTRIFRKSDVYRQICNNREFYFPDNEYIIGDKAYPVMSWCIPPYIDRGNLTQHQRHFNTILSRTRQVIENSFALLFGRFRRLKFLDMNRTDYIPATVLAACVLHNICLDHNDLFIQQYIREGLNNVHHNDDDDNMHNEDVAEGRLKRDELCGLFNINNNID